MVRTKSIPRRFIRGRRERIRLTLREAKTFVKDRSMRIDLFNKIVFYKRMGLLVRDKVPTVAEIQYAKEQYIYITNCTVILNKEEPQIQEMTWICPICKLPENGCAMIGCDSCDNLSSWYHFTCVGIDKVPPKAQQWICPKCEQN